MNKKTAVALAVGAAFATPAFAQTTGTTIEIYGRLYPQLTSARAKGATAPGAAPSNLVSQNGPTEGDHQPRLSVDTSNSRIGFRGREPLGGGLAAIWQIESRVRFDTGAGNLWAGNRPSFVGLRGGLGTVRLGMMDTIYKEYGGVVGRFFGASSGNFVSSSNVLSEIGLNVEDSTGRGGQGQASGFHIRASNAVTYETPELGGFIAGITYSPDERKGNPGRGNTDANLWSFAVKYEAGPVLLALGHERHNDWFDGSANSAVPNTGIGTTAESRDTAWRVSATYAVTTQHRLTGDVSRLEWKESGQPLAGQFERYQKNTWAVGWEARWGGPWSTEITYVRAGEGTCSLSGGAPCSTAGLKGTLVNAGLGYVFSKRTTVYALGSKLTNGESAQFSNTANFDPNRGADTTNFALGMIHSF